MAAGPAACAGAGDATAGTITGAPSAQQITAFVRAHNNERCNAMPVPLTMPAVEWDPIAAGVAQAYANQCNFSHNAARHAQYAQAGGSGQLGENIMWGTGQYTPNYVVTYWASEKTNYTLATNSCTGVCGHYTQIVWANTLRVGCGTALCNGTTFVVCDYSPAGNYVGQAPYVAAP